MNELEQEDFDEVLGDEDRIGIEFDFYFSPRSRTFVFEVLVGGRPDIKAYLSREQTGQLMRMMQETLDSRSNNS